MKGVWNGAVEEKAVASTETSAMLEELRPAVTYHVRVFAENRLGPGEPSDVIQFTTDEEGSPFLFYLSLKYILI